MDEAEARGEKPPWNYFTPPRRPVAIPDDLLHATPNRQSPTPWASGALSDWVAAVHGWGESGGAQHRGRLLYWPTDHSWWVLQYGWLEVVLVCGSKTVLDAALPPDPQAGEEQFGEWLLYGGDPSDRIKDPDDLAVTQRYAPFQQA